MSLAFCRGPTLPQPAPSRARTLEAGKRWAEGIRVPGTEYIMRNAGLGEAQAGIKIARRNINNLRYVLLPYFSSDTIPKSSRRLFLTDAMHRPPCRRISPMDMLHGPSGCHFSSKMWYTVSPRLVSDGPDTLAITSQPSPPSVRNSVSSAEATAALVFPPD